MADGDTDGLDVILCPQQTADHLILIQERCEVSPLWSGLLRLSDQTGFSAPNGGHIEQNTQVAGQAKTSGMSDTLAVTNDQIRSEGQFFHGFDDGWKLPE